MHKVSDKKRETKREININRSDMEAKQSGRKKRKQERDQKKKRQKAEQDGGKERQRHFQ